MIERQLWALLLSMLGITLGLIGLWAIAMFVVVAMHGYVHLGYMLLMVLCAIASAICRYLGNKLIDSI